MLHPDTRLVWVDDRIGYGVVATRPIPRGTVLWTLDPLDQRMTASQVAALGETWRPTLEHFTYTNATGLRILCWDLARYMNHHCEPASLSPGTNFELAVRDLAVGDAVTCDYSSLNLEADLDCACGSPRCRGVIRAKDGPRLAREWDAALQQAIVAAVRVDQPLLPFVEERDQFAAWAAHPSTLPSARVHLRRHDSLHRPPPRRRSRPQVNVGAK